MPIQETSLSIGRQQGDQPEAIDIAGNMSAGIKTGMQLASVQDTLDKQKMDVQNQKMELAQKQATAMTNRTKAAVFANSPASFEAIMKGNEAYANSIGVPYNGEAIRAAWKDPTLRLAAQREISNILSGGEMKNPQAIVDMYGADSHVILQQLQESSYANAQVKNKDVQQSKLENIKGSYGLQEAQIRADATVNAAGMRTANQERRMNQADSREYNKVVLPIETNIQQADRSLALINKIASGELKSTKTLRSELGLGTARLLSGKAPTVAGFESVELDNSYSAFKDKWAWLFSKPVDTIDKDNLEQMKLDLQALKDETASQHQIAYESLAAGKDSEGRRGMDARYAKFRELTHLPIDTIRDAPKAPAASGQAPPPPANDQQAKIAKAKAAGYSDAEIKAFLERNK